LVVEPTKDAHHSHNIKSVQVSGKGVGCVATRRIRIGDLILHEKALAAAHSLDPTSSMGLLLDFSSRICLAGNELALAEKVIRLVQNIKAFRSAFFQLYSGTGEKYNDDDIEVDGNLVIDV